jgi:hypothetical protein
VELPWSGLTNRRLTVSLLTLRGVTPTWLAGNKYECFQIRPKRRGEKDLRLIIPLDQPYVLNFRADLPQDKEKTAGISRDIPRIFDAGLRQSRRKGSAIFVGHAVYDTP